MPPSDKNTNSKTLILLGFSFVIVLMALIIFMSVTEFDNARKQLQEIVNVNNYKKTLVEDMHISAFKRVSSLQRMILLSDPFEQDDAAMFIDEQGSIFTAARQNLLLTSLNNKEMELLDTQAKYALITVPVIRKITNLIRDENTTLAQQLINNKLIPAQTEIFKSLSQLQSIQENNIRNAFNSMLLAQDHSKLYMLSLGLLAALVSIVIAFLTYRRVRFTEKLLSQEKERAQITLKNIVDGVITTNDHGLIDFINPTALAMTGWQKHKAIGQPLLKVLNLTDSALQKACRSIEDFKHCSKTELILITRQKEQIAIEHNTSLLPSNSIYNQSMVVTFRNVTEARQLTETLSFQAKHDPLTGLHNRLAFEDNLQQRIDDSRNQTQSHILCFLDLDHFKNVNDSAGHIAGDELLIQLTKIFSKHIRNSDFLARIGGDEFAIILDNCDTEKALDITEDIRMETDEHNFEWMGHTYEVSVSIGITIFNNQDQDITRILERADSACYQAKTGGKNLIKIYTDTTDKANKHALT